MKVRDHLGADTYSTAAFDWLAGLTATPEMSRLALFHYFQAGSARCPDSALWLASYREHVGLIESGARNHNAMLCPVKE